MSAVSTFLFYPIVLKHLGAESFGIWATIVSFTALFAFADFGIGNGIISPLASAFGKDDSEEVRRIASSGFALALTISIGAFLAGLGLLLVLDLGFLLDKGGKVGEEEVRMALQWLLVSFCCAIPLTIVYRIQIALQQGANAAAWQTLGILGSCVAVIFAVNAGGSLSELILAQTFPPVVAGVLNLLHFVQRRNHSFYALGYRYVAKSAALNLLRTGGFFFVMQLSMAAAFSSDILLITILRGAEEAAHYAVAAKLFSVASIFMGAYAQTLWPAYSEAHSRGDGMWVNERLRQSLFILPGAATLFCICLVAAWGPTVEFWISRPPSTPPLLLAFFSLWVVAESVGHCYSALLNGLTVIRFQLVLAVAFAIVCFGGMWLTIGLLGSPGAILARASAYITIVLIPYSLFDRKRRHA